jgi:hypothetical protein
MMKRRIVVLSISVSARQPFAGDFKLTTFFDNTAFYKCEPVAAWLVANNSGADTMIISEGAAHHLRSLTSAARRLSYVGTIVRRVSGGVDESQIVRPRSRSFAEMLDYSFRLGAGTYLSPCSAARPRHSSSQLITWHTTERAEARAALQRAAASDRNSDLAGPTGEGDSTQEETACPPHHASW